MQGFIYIAGTIFFTVYGQLIIKWRMNKFGPLPKGLSELIPAVIHVLFDPWILSGLISAFLASLFWMAAMAIYDISFAYPFMSLSFVFVIFGSAFLFGEPITMGKIAGLCFIIIGIIIIGRSMS
jgi:drug/metabolite transporter (DMT)-like permease